MTGSIYLDGFGVFCIVVTLYHLLILGRFSFSKPKSYPKFEQPVSVIICSRNEEDNLRELVPILLKQNHHNFEIVLINDRSWDKTAEVIDDFERQHANVRAVHVFDNDYPWPGKKFALTMGIKAANYEHMIFTDADCRPCSDEWIAQMASGFSKAGAEVVIGYGPYIKEKGLLNRIIRHDTFTNAELYLSWALWNGAYMAVGRNMGYTKTVFYRNQGFMDHIRMLSGDDDLFIQQACNRKNTAVITGELSHTLSIPKYSWKEWIHQKMRHYSAAPHYKKVHKLKLGFHSVLKLGFPIATAAVGFFEYSSPWFWAMTLGSLFIIWLVNYMAARKLKTSDLAWGFFLTDFLFTLSQFIIYIRSKKSGPLNW